VGRADGHSSISDCGARPGLHGLNEDKYLGL